MEADLSRLETGLAAAEFKFFELEREVRTLMGFFVGKNPTTIAVPSGVEGTNFTFEVMAQPLGAVPADDGRSFIGSYSTADGTIEVGPGSYQYPLGTNTDVKTTDAAAGKYVYAVIEQDSEGAFSGFEIKITSETKDPVVMDATDRFVEFSNVLMAEVVGSGDTAELVQRRIGNLSLIHRLINGSFCIWPETTGGSFLPE